MESQKVPSPSSTTRSMAQSSTITIHPQSLTGRPPKSYRFTQKESFCSLPLPSIFQGAMSVKLQGGYLPTDFLQILGQGSLYDTNPNNALLFTGIPSTLPYICIKFDAPKIGNSMTLVGLYSFWMFCGEMHLISSHQYRRIFVNIFQPLKHRLGHGDMPLMLQKSGKYLLSLW